MKDLIDRTKALEAIRAIDDHGDPDRANALGLAEWAVKGLPSVQPEREKGKWLKHGGMIYCSNCANSFETYFIHDFIYCPNCGADMRGEENG